MGREKMTNLQPREEEEEEEESDQEQEDAISLCDLSADHYQEDSDNYDNGGNFLDQLDRDSEEDKFEFSFTNPNPSSIITNQNDAGLADSDDNSINAINFCGKIIGYNNNNNNNSNNNTNSNNAKNDKQRGEAVNTTTRVVENQTRPLKKSTSAESLSRSQLATGSCRYRSSSSKSNSSRYKHKALIGLVKIPTEMDLSDIKKRQSKMRNPTTTSWPMLPVGAAAEPAVAGVDNGSTAGGGGSERRRNNSNRWGLFRSLACGARLANVLA